VTGSWDGFLDEVDASDRLSSSGDTFEWLEGSLTWSWDGFLDEMDTFDRIPDRGYVGVD
jgi:hypothetical protein